MIFTIDVEIDKRQNSNKNDRYKKKTANHNKIEEQKCKQATKMYAKFTKRAIVCI